MKISILGAKVIGATLGRKWVKAGHSVMFGVRNIDNPEVRQLVQDLGERASVGTISETIEAGDIVLFAIPGAAMAETVRHHQHALANKAVIDATNNMTSSVMNSLATFQQYTPQAPVFRAFNSLGWENFENPEFDGLQADLFYCGPQGQLQSMVARLIADVGLRPIYLGGLDKIQLVDMIGSLWFALAYGQNMGRHLAFKVLTRSS